MGMHVTSIRMYISTCARRVFVLGVSRVGLSFSPGVGYPTKILRSGLCEPLLHLPEVCDGDDFPDILQEVILLLCMDMRPALIVERSQDFRSTARGYGHSKVEDGTCYCIQKCDETLSSKGDSKLKQFMLLRPAFFRRHQ